MISSTAPVITSSPRKLNGMALRDHRFELPLDYSDLKGEKIKVFAREVCLRDLDNNKDLPWMVFFKVVPDVHPLAPQ
ncbi:MAG: hypothetical protein QNL01_09720 [Akkermansiaceae bacterium]